MKGVLIKKAVGCQSASAMQPGRVVDLTASLAMVSSMLSLKDRLPMADSIILATALAFEATLWTQDADFRNLSGGKYFPKHSPHKNALRRHYQHRPATQIPPPFIVTLPTKM